MKTFKTLHVTALAVLALATAAEAQFSVRGIDAPGATNITNIDQAESLLASEPTFGTIQSPAVINYFDGTAAGDVAGDTVFPGLGATDQFALDATGFLTFNTLGNYVFRVHSDDGFRLRFDGSLLSEFTGPRSPGATDAPVFSPLSLGSVVGVRLTYFEQAGQSELEFSYSLNGGPQTLVGASNDITVRSTRIVPGVPEPATTLGLFGLAMAAIVAFRSRCC